MHAATDLPVDSQPLGDTFPPQSLGQAAKPSARIGRNKSSRASANGSPSNERNACAVDPVDLHILYRETGYQLDRFDAMVREGKHIEFAHGFTTYVLNARIPHLLRRYPATGTLKVDGAFLDWRVRELKQEVQRQYVSKKAPGVPQSELELVNHKLNIIAGQLAKLTVLYDQK